MYFYCKDKDSAFFQQNTFKRIQIYILIEDLWKKNKDMYSHHNRINYLFTLRNQTTILSHIS
jgi:hypothetical protein